MILELSGAEIDALAHAIDGYLAPRLKDHPFDMPYDEHESLLLSLLVELDDTGLVEWSQ